jgi:hypothetical protein
MRVLLSQLILVVYPQAFFQTSANRERTFLTLSAFDFAQAPIRCLSEVQTGA